MSQKLMAPLTAVELLTLQEMGRHHRHGEFRFRARGLISIDAQQSPKVVAEVLGVSEQSVYNWVKWWRRSGLAGLLDGRGGGRPVKLTEELVASAVEIARSEPLTLDGIRQRVRERHPDAPEFSVDRLSARLKEKGLSYKRCRLSLKKSVMTPPSPKKKRFSTN